MKVKKKISVSILVLVMLTISTLFFTTKSKVYAAEEEGILQLINVELSDKSDTVEVSNVDFEGVVINSNILYHKVGDYATYKVTIQNNDTQDYKIKEITDSNDNEYISYEYSEYENKEVKAGETAEFNIKVTYSKEAKYLDEGLDNFSIQEMDVEISITLEDSEGNVVTEKIIMNPPTGDSITQYIIIFSMSIVGVVTLVLLNKKGKLNKKIIGLFIIVALITPVVVYASTSSNLNFTGNITLNDKSLVTFVYDAEKSEVISYIVNYGESIQVPPIEEVDEGFEAKGWFDEDGHIYEEEITNVTNNIFLYPNLIPIEYTIEYNLDGGNIEGKVDTYTCISDDITLPTPKKSGFKFVGWTGSNGDEPEKEVVITSGSLGNKSYTANWEELEYETSQETYPTDQRYTYFGEEDSGWKDTDNDREPYDWFQPLPTITFSEPISRVRLGYSSTGYVTYNYQSDAIGFISHDKMKVWFSDNYGYNIDGYYTLGYTQNSVDHELRCQVSGGEIVSIENIY